MFNMFIDTLSDINGKVFRIKDFINYCNDTNIEISFNKNKNNPNNIIDVDYLYSTKDYNIKGYIFMSAFDRYFDDLKELQKRTLIFHNLMYTKLCNGIFFPMFMYKNRINYKPNIKYKYGLYTSTSDANRVILIDILKELNTKKEEILLLDRDSNFKLYGYNTTQNTEELINSVENILDISSK